MSTVMERRAVAASKTSEIQRGEQISRATMTTTLYDLIATIQAAMTPDEDDLVVPIVAHMLKTGHASFLRVGRALACEGVSWP